MSNSIPVPPKRAPRRLSDVDTVRILGIIAVVAGHTWVSSWVRLAFYPWHVPLFFIASGYFWTAGRRTIAQEAAVRFRTILIPYFAFLVILIPVVLVANHGLNISAMGSDLLSLLIGGRRLVSPFSAFWFVTALFFAAIGYRILDGVNFWAKGLLTFALFATGSLFGHFYAKSPWSVLIGLTCLFFLWAGEAIRRYGEIHRWGFAVGLLLLVEAAAVIVYTGAYLDLKNGDYGMPGISGLLAVQISWGLFLLMKPLRERVSERGSGVINALALTGFGVVLGHAVVLWLGRPYLPVPVLFLIACAGTWAASLLVHRTPLSPWFLGVTQKVRSPRP